MGKGIQLATLASVALLAAGGGGGGGGQYKCGRSDLKPQPMVFAAPIFSDSNLTISEWNISNDAKDWNLTKAPTGTCTGDTQYTGDEDEKVEQSLRCVLAKAERPCRNWCHDENSFLGVGNPICIGQNVVTSSLLVVMIIVLSLLFAWVEETLRERCSGSPQMRAIHAHMVQEVTILGFISMIVFVFQTNGVTDALAARDTLGPEDLFHFKEFFHFVIFLTMICYIATVLILLHTSTKIPQLWHVAQAAEGEDKDGALGDGETPTPGPPSARPLAGGGASPSPSAPSIGRVPDRSVDSDPSMGGRHTSRTKQVLDEYLAVEKCLDGHPWGVWGRKFDLRLQRRLYKAVNRVAFRLCKSQARDVYSSRRLMHAMFDTSMDMPSAKLNFTEYSLRATQLLLVEVLEVHWTNWAAVLVLLLLNSARVKAGADVNLTGADQTASGGDRGTTVFVCAGIVLVLANLAICYKGWAVLQRVVESRIPHSGGGGVKRWRDIGRLVRPVLLEIGRMVVVDNGSPGYTPSRRLQQRMLTGDSTYSVDSSVHSTRSTRPSLNSMVNLLHGPSSQYVGNRDGRNLSAVEEAARETAEGARAPPEAVPEAFEFGAKVEVEEFYEGGEHDDIDDDEEGYGGDSLEYTGRDSDAEDDGTDSDDADDEVGGGSGSDASKTMLRPSLHAAVTEKPVTGEPRQSAAALGTKRSSHILVFADNRYSGSPSSPSSLPSSSSRGTSQHNPFTDPGDGHNRHSAQEGELTASEQRRRDRLMSVGGSRTGAPEDYDNFFWFKRPELLVRALQFTIFFQAIYLAFFFLMFAKRGIGDESPWGGAAIAIQVLCPALILLVITPLSLPLFVVLLDLIGYLGEEKMDEYLEQLRRKRVESTVESEQIHREMAERVQRASKATAEVGLALATMKAGKRGERGERPSEAAVL